MKLFSESTYRTLFWIGIVLKGIISVVEVVLGVLLYFVDYTTLFQWASYLTGDELIEAPRDLIIRYGSHALAGFTDTSRLAWAFIFLSHGIVKTLLAIGIIKEVRWSYPVAAIIFGIFAIYQDYQFSYAPSFILAAITLFDIALIFLIIHEYEQDEHKRRHATA